MCVTSGITSRMKSSRVALFIFTGLVLNCLEEVCGSPAGKLVKYTTIIDCSVTGYSQQLAIMIEIICFTDFVGMQDVQITPTGRCADAGITSGCCVPEHDSAHGETEVCRVYTSVDTSCYCDVRCHETQFDDCCSDINEIQCYDRELYHHY